MSKLSKQPIALNRHPQPIEFDQDSTMKTRRLFSQSLFCKLALSVLLIPATQVFAFNRSPIANAGVDQSVGLSKRVTLDGSRSVDRDGDGSLKSYRWSQVVADDKNAALKLPPTVSLAAPLTAKPTFTTTKAHNNKTLYFKLEVTDAQGNKDRDTVAVSVEGPSTLGKLNDTGIKTCGETRSSGDKCPVKGYPGQDGQFGRDVTHNDDTDGHAGFSFTKISSTGMLLPANAKRWNCVKDNVTGLVWEVKTNDGGLHDKDWTYTWYEPDGTKNGGNAGKTRGGKCGATSACNTYAYVKAVNAKGWCGKKDWRMPTVDELFSICVMDRFSPGIDVRYFPNTPDEVFWSSSPYTGDGDDKAWMVGSGSFGYYKDDDNHVRLVRGGQ